MLFAQKFRPFEL